MILNSLYSENVRDLFLWADNTSVTLQDCLQYLQSLSSAQRSFYSEVCVLIQLILVMPATNAVSERSFSSMRRLKSYIRSTMNQSRINHVMILHLNKEKVDSLDLNISRNELVEGKKNLLKYFVKFKWSRVMHHCNCNLLL